MYIYVYIVNCSVPQNVCHVPLQVHEPFIPLTVHYYKTKDFLARNDS